MCTAYRKLASSRTPDASRQTFPDWQQSAASSSSSSQAPRPGPRLASLLASSPTLRSECLWVTWDPYIPSPKDPGPPCPQQSQRRQSCSPPQGHLLPGTPLREGPQFDPFHDDWTSLSLVLGHHPNGPFSYSMQQGGHITQMMPRCFRSTAPPAALTVTNSQCN